MKIYYVKDATRSHKLMVLLDGLLVTDCSKLRNCLRLFPRDSGIVLIDSFGLNGLKGAFLSLILRSPLVVRLRGDFIRESIEVYQLSPTAFAWIKRKIHQAIEALCIYRSCMVLVNSIYMDRILRRYYPNKQTAVVYNPYTFNFINNQTDYLLPIKGCHLLSITNFNLQSKVQPLIAAIEKWMPEDFWNKYDLHWVVCGAGPLSHEFETRIKRLPFSNRIHFLGYVHNVEPVINWASIFVHISELDAFPNVTLEAMMCEKPIIINAQSCGTLEQVINNFNGFIISGSNEFIASVTYLIENPHIASKFGKAGKKIVEQKFSVQVQSKNLRKAFIEVMDNCE